MYSIGWKCYHFVLSNIGEHREGWKWAQMELDMFC
jgi:hypothetical protein